MKIAVVGAGISGLGSAYLLSQEHEVHLFESASRLGGHAHTVSVREDKTSIPMDTGFLVYNELTYPQLTALFKHLDVETVASDMSLSVQVKSKNLEWNGTDFNGIFSQRRNLLNPRFYLMLSEIVRFGREAETSLVQARRHGWSLRDLLARQKYSNNFRQNYLLPIGAAIWSTPEEKMLDFPAETFLNFFINHKLLQVMGRPTWRTVKNGSIQYVEKIARHISHIHLDSPVVEVLRESNGVLVRTAKEDFVFDRVVMATHAPLTLSLIKNPTAQEQAVLGAFRYEANHALLHQDKTVMPRAHRAWASWNVVGHGRPEEAKKVSLAYYLNRLQPLQTQQDYFLTLNPIQNLKSVINKFDYEHPQFDQRAIRAQGELTAIQGVGGLYYAGAWTRYGFHEDGLLSAVKVAELMSISTPWKIA